MPAITIISPHPDDAVFSAWHLLAGPEDAVRVLNIFDGVPEADHEVGWWDQATGATDSATRARERHEEDRRALSLVRRGASGLGFLDAQYRNGSDPFDAVLEAAAAAVPEDGLLLAPAALGNHPDHEIARQVALALAERGAQVGLYADLPHATLRGWPPLTASAFRDGRVYVLDEPERRRKLEAVRCYDTQTAELEARYSILSDPEVLGYEVIWEPRSVARSVPGGDGVRLGRRPGDGRAARWSR